LCIFDHDGNQAHLYSHKSMTAPIAEVAN